MDRWENGGKSGGEKIKKKRARGGVIESLMGNLVGCDGGGRKME